MKDHAAAPKALKTMEEHLSGEMNIDSQEDKGESGCAATGTRPLDCFPVRLRAAVAPRVTVDHLTRVLFEEDLFA
jgi:hypothetical protein